MATITVLRPDNRQRVGLGVLIRRTEAIIGRPISGYAAEVRDDGSVLLSPRVEGPVEASLSLSTADRDRFLEALRTPTVGPRLQAALRDHQRQVGAGS